MVNDRLFEKVVSPPDKEILNFFCSSFSALDIFDKFLFVKVFLLPDAAMK